MEPSEERKKLLEREETLKKQIKDIKKKLGEIPLYRQLLNVQRQLVYVKHELHVDEVKMYDVYQKGVVVKNNESER